MLLHFLRPWRSEVQVKQATHMAVLLHPAITGFVHPCTADVGRYAYKDVGGRAAPGAGSRELRRSSCRRNYLPTSAFRSRWSGGNDCSYNLIAFPPSMEVRGASAVRVWQGLLLQTLCISSFPGGQMLRSGLHPWRSEVKDLRPT